MEGEYTLKYSFVKLQVRFAAAKQQSGILLFKIQLVGPLLARKNIFCNFAKHSDFCKNENNRYTGVQSVLPNNCLPLPVHCEKKAQRNHYYAPGSSKADRIADPLQQDSHTC